MYCDMSACQLYFHSLIVLSSATFRNLNDKTVHHDLPFKEVSEEAFQR